MAPGGTQIQWHQHPPVEDPDHCTPDFLTLLVAPGHNPLQTRLAEAQLILPHTWLWQ